ncbi:MAG: hypothetical protein AB7D37_11020 [Desulfovibrio sp.]
MGGVKGQADDGYVEVEIEGTIFKVKKLTPPIGGKIVAWEGIVDKDGKQIVCSEDNIRAVLEDNPHLSEILSGAITDNVPDFVEWMKAKIGGLPT